MILNILRWFSGYVSFEVVGGYPEKFINLSVKNSINLWNLKRIGADFKAEIKASEYKKLRFIARASNSKVRICAKHGLPFFIFRHRKRWGVVTGVFVFLIFLYCCSLYIWNIKIVGNNELKSEEIMSTLDSAGLSVGTLKSRINPSEIEEITMSKFDKISWMSVNIKGGSVSVEIKEKLDKPEMVKSNEPCNIVACQDGQIERMETYRGAAVVGAGEVVTKGQLLISGVSEGEGVGSEFLNADGKVFAKTKEKITERIPLSYVKAEDTGKLVRKIRIKLFGLEIPLWAPGKCDDNFRKETHIDSWNIFGIDLPVKIYKEFLYEQNMCTCELSLEDARAKGQQGIAEKENNCLNGANILEKAVKETKNDDEYIVEATYTCVKNIAKQERMSFE